MFINPMWVHESQRIGKQKCTPLGYMLHGISDLIGLIGFLCLLGVPIYLVYSGVRGQFTWSMLWYLLIPFAIAIIGNVLHSYLWCLADQKQFKYDYERSVASWVESGIQKSYEYGRSDDEAKQSGMD